MASRYPSQLDDVDNLLTVRDNLTDIGGDVLNRLRDSILAIERTLGINIQGTFADLASRLAVIINPDGSINKQAFQVIGGIFGPIRNDDVDPNAQIAENKLNLNFPTALLQDEIKILDSRNAGLIDLILSANAGLQEHVTRAVGAHRATAIATDVQTIAVQSSNASLKIEQSNVQLVLQDIYAGHINFYPGINSDKLTLTNSPHQANQIFYDNRNTELPTNSIQGAIDNLFLKGDSFISDHQRQLHSNGIQRRVERVDTDNSSGIGRGRIIISAFTGTLSYADLGGATTSILINIPIQQGASLVGIPLVIVNTDGTTEAIPIDVDDSLQITDPLGNQYALLPITDLKITAYTDPATNLTTNYLLAVDVFYNPDVFSALFTANGITESNPSIQIIGSVYKKIDVQGSENALNCVARVLKPNSVAEPNLSSSVSEIQIAHPNAATIVSKGFNSSALGRRSDGYFDRNFTSILTIVVDGSTYQVQIVPNSPVDITLDTCVAKSNLEFLKQNIPITAYRLGQEMALTHNWPDDIFIAGTRHTIRIISGGGVDASIAAGFSYIANTTVYGSAGNSFIVNGVQRSTLRIKIPLQGTASLGKSGFSIFGNVIVFNDAENNPLVAGVREGDVVNLQGLTSSSTASKLDGIRRIDEVSSNTIKVDGDPYPIDVQLTDSATLVVYSNVIALDDLAHRFQTDFAGLDPNLSQNVVVQIFMNSSGELDFHERIIYPNAATLSGLAYGGSPTLPITNLTTDDHGVYIIDCSRGLDGDPQGQRRLISLQFDNRKRVFASFGCQSTPNDGYTLSSSLHGPPINITGDGKYNLIDETGLNFVTLQSVKSFNLLSDTILSTIPDGKLLTYVLPVVKFDQINEFENLLLCNVYYNSQVNEIPILNGDLALADKRYTGTLGAEQVRDDVVERYVSGPMGETRGSGIVSGMFVPSDLNATSNITNDKVVYVNGGVVYVQGVRYEISSQQIYVDPATLDISQYGTDGYFPGTGSPPNGNGTFKNGYIRYYVFVDHFGRLQTTSRLNLPASLPFVPLAKVVLTTTGLLNNSPNIILVNVVDFRLFLGGIDDKIELTVGSVLQQPAHFHSITAALEYVDNLRYNDVITGTNLHVRPTLIRLLEGVYQEPTSLEIPPFVTIRGESSRSVRIRPPVSLLNASSVSQLTGDTEQNRFIFNINVLPEGVSAKVESICFDTNVGTTTPTNPAVPGGKVGAIKVTWFNNTSSNVNVQAQLASSPSIVDIKDCLFILDGPMKSTGITTVFGVATPLIAGGISKFSYSYNQLYSKIYFSDYFEYKQAPTDVPVQNPQPAPPPAVPAQPVPPVIVSPPPTPEPNPGAPDGYNSPPNVIQINPKAPFVPEDAIFTDVNAPAGFDHGGIMNIENNTFIVTNGYGSVCVDRFYDVTTTAGYASLTPVPVSNTRMRAFKIVNNSFRYNNTDSANSIANKISLGINGIVATTTPTDSATGAAGQESLKDQMYDLMIHKELRGFVPSLYPNGNIYPDPKDGYNIPDGYNVPPAGGKVTEFMVISGNTPTGLNIPEATPVRFATETQDSIARDQHGGGIIFASVTIPKTGLPVVIDRSVDWHDRYIFAYGNDALTNPSASVVNATIKNILYTNPTPIQNISSGVSFVPAANNVTMNAQSVDKAMNDYGSGTTPTSHALVYGYASRLSGDLVTIKHPAQIQMPGWSHIKYIGTFSFSDLANNISLVVMPNGELAAIHAGTQDPNNLSQNTRLIQTSDSYPASPDTSRGSSIAKTLSLVIQYSPKLNILTISQYDSTVTTDNLDNIGKGFGKI